MTSERLEQKALEGALKKMFPTIKNPQGYNTLMRAYYRAKRRKQQGSKLQLSNSYSQKNLARDF